MLPFLERVEREELDRLVRRAIGGRSTRAIEEADREQLARILFSVYGFDLLYEKSIRRALLLGLPANDLRALAVSCDIGPEGKQFDLALQIAGRPWRAGTAVVRRVAEALSIPEAFLPESSPKSDVVELVEPFIQPPPLFDYQEELVAKIVDLLEGPPGSCALMQLPTGAGKTRTTMEAIARFLDKLGQEGAFRSVLWLAHTEELCDQAVESFRRTWQASGSFEIRLARFWGSYRPRSEDMEGAFIVGGYQKIAGFRKRFPADYEALLANMRVLVVDEAHKALAPTISSLLEYAKSEGGVRIIGLSATPGRGAEVDLENKRLARVFGRTLLRPTSLGSDPIAELQRRGILARIRHLSVESGATVQGGVASDEDGDLAPESLRDLATNSERNEIISDVVESQIREGRPTLVFCCTVEHAKQLAIQMALRGSPSAYIDCRMRRGLRRRIVRAFRDGGVQVLFNYGVLSTGFDAPNIECVIVGRPTTSIVLYSQMIGRGLRGAVVGGTSAFTLVDVRDNVEAFGGIQSVYNHFDPFWR